MYIGYIKNDYYQYILLTVYNIYFSLRLFYKSIFHLNYCILKLH